MLNDKRLNFTANNSQLTAGMLVGVLVASSTGGTIRVADTAGTICNTMAVVAGGWYPMPCNYVGTLTITVGGTLDATLFYKL